MKLSEETVKVLKNFSDINNQIVIRKTPEGKDQSVIHTIDRDKQIYGRTIVDQAFPVNICLYDLKAFLSIFEMLDEPEVDFREQDVLLTKGQNDSNIIYADSVVIIHPSKELQKQEGDFSFELKKDDYEKVVNAGAMMSLPHLHLYSKDGALYLQAEDKRSPNSNTFKVKVGDVEGDHSIYFKIEAMKIIPADYKVTVNADAATFEHAVNSDLYYIIALDKTA